MEVNDLMDKVLGTLTELEMAVFQARSENLTYPMIGELLGISELGAQKAYVRVQYKFGKAFMPIAYREIKAGNVTDEDISLPKPQTSRFKGVHWHGRRRKWYAGLWVDGKKVHVGRFEDEEEAARSYDAAALRLLGPDAVTNASLGLLEETNAA